MSSATKQGRILVLGDLNLDALLIPVRSSGAGRMAWQREGDCWRYRHRGGSWLLTEMINAALQTPSVASQFAAITAETYDAKDAADDLIERTSPPDYLNSATILGLFPQSAEAENRLIYRVDRFLGWVHNTLPATLGPGRPYTQRLKELLERFSRPSESPRNILVFHDTTGHFRDLDKELLRQVLQAQFSNEKAWIVWHMHSPLATGPLWDVINEHKEWLDRVVVVVNMECLRQAGMNLPQATSLEQESDLFMRGMQEVERLRDLAKVRKIVAHQHHEGVLLYDRHRKLETSCYYCPYISANTSFRDYGVMVGYTSILVAAIVRGLAWSMQSGSTTVEDGLVAGIKQGAVLDHLHFLHGFGRKEDLLSSAAPDLAKVTNPYGRLFAALTELSSANWEVDGKNYRATALRLPGGDSDLRTWSRIDAFIKTESSNSTDSLDQKSESIAYEIVRSGLRQVVEERDTLGTSAVAKSMLPDTPPDAIRCPYEVHGVIKTAYHLEIEGIANIRRIMEKYLHDERWTAPLSIAVFGQPGSGKSFTIKQILQNLKADVAKRPLEFNLAQFESSKDLEIAFHKVQDEAVAGGVPLVFFDEFDADQFKWLKFFLAPMQDGKFKAGESTYRIGRAIFVFAGGVSKSWNEFYEQRKELEDFKEQKVPDFVSRLRGYLEILSINDENNISGVLMFRRAILLRSLLELHQLEIFDKNSKQAWIDHDVVRAFLRVPRYEHDVRSMEAIIQMSRVSPRGFFHKSSLPSLEQLKMHVDGEKFCELLSQPTSSSKS